jgi:hypothetical protein
MTSGEKARFNTVAGDMIHRFALLRPVGSASTLAQK